ncbi:hypothetical protein [Azospirillum sp.]|uniref:hypothetical protein n=1 Tax=Azospirillum sp. TaxID=34012 RepID=UPI002D305771|nr:hypothetical protein [Azospirillum sp.]HYD69139.1 hypothetical protein [Azospirillum sp.]
MDEANIGNGGHAEPIPDDAVEARPAVREAMAKAGFAAVDTGDGCLAWCRSTNDGTHTMISCNNSLDGDPASADWIAGRYGDEGGFVEVNGLGLAGALDAADLLPAPVRVDGSVVEALYPSLQQALDDLA